MRPLLILLILILSACSPPPAQEQLLGAIKEIELAVEDRHAGDVLDFIADDFSGNDNLDKRQLHSYMVRLFFQHKRIEVVLTDLELVADTTDANRYVMQASVVLLGGQSVTPGDVTAYRLRGHWRLADGDWLLEKLTWQ